jgi:WYL domain
VPTGEVFERAPGFGLAGYWREYLADFQQRLHTGHAVIRVSPAGAERMRGLLSAATVLAIESGGTAGPDGWITARVPIESARQALGDFLRLGADLEILAPADLRAAATGICQAMAALYQ